MENNFEPNFTHFKILYLKIIHFCLQTKDKMLRWDQLRYAFTYLMFLRQLSYLISLELSQLWSIIPIFLSEIRISRVSCLIFEIRQASKLSASQRTLVNIIEILQRYKVHRMFQVQVIFYERILQLSVNLEITITFLYWFEER